MRICATTLGVFLVLFHAGAYPQDSQRAVELAAEVPDSVRRDNSLRVLFERNINTFNWLGRASIDTLALGTRVKLNESYTSNIILVEGTTPERRLQSSQQRLSLLLGRPVSSDVSTQVHWSSLIYSDNKSVGLSTASIHSLLGGIEYSPLPVVSLNPMVGYRWDNQVDVRDRGLSYNIAARTRNLDLDGYRIDGRAQFQEDRLDPRLLGKHFARMQVQKNFLGNTRDSLDVGVVRTRREFYAFGTDEIESRIENILSLANLLDYEISRNFNATLFVNLTNRALDKDIRSIGGGSGRVQFNTGIDEFRLETYFQSSYRSDDGRTGVSARISHSERNERHFAKPIEGDVPDSVRLLFNVRNRQEQTKDNLARRTSLAGTVEFPVTHSDRILLSGAASILRYDTPSELNIEDRDELLVAISLSTFHTVSQFLNVSLTLDGNLSHVVYLLKDRSANNNFNRVLRLSPRTMYRPFKELTTMNQFEVLANYTVYDFEEQVLQVRSFSYRQFSWLDSTSLELTPRLGLDFFVYLKLYERGQLNWHEFTERQENSFADKTYAGQVRFTPLEGTLFAVGLRYFSQTRYGYSTGEKRLESFLRSLGPTCAIIWKMSSFSELGLRGWYEHRQLDGGATRALANMTMNIHITL